MLSISNNIVSRFFSGLPTASSTDATTIHEKVAQHLKNSARGATANDLMESIGCSRTSLCRPLKDLCEEGRIGKGFKVFDPKADRKVWLYHSKEN